MLNEKRKRYISEIVVYNLKIDSEIQGLIHLAAEVTTNTIERILKSNAPYQLCVVILAF
jgi:hypothetical protein